MKTMAYTMIGLRLGTVTVSPVPEIDGVLAGDYLGSMGKEPERDGQPANEYLCGFRDGWRSVPNSGEPPPMISYVNSGALAFADTYYDAGYLRGREGATRSTNA